MEELRAALKELHRGLIRNAMASAEIYRQFPTKENAVKWGKAKGREEGITSVIRKIDEIQAKASQPSLIGG